MDKRFCTQKTAAGSWVFELKKMQEEEVHVFENVEGPEEDVSEEVGDMSVSVSAWLASRPGQWAYTGAGAGTYRLSLAPGAEVVPFLVVKVEYDFATSKLSVRGRPITLVMVNHFFYEHELPLCGPVYIVHPLSDAGTFVDGKHVTVALCHGRTPMQEFVVRIENHGDDVVRTGLVFCVVCGSADSRFPLCVPRCGHKYHAHCAGKVCIVCGSETELPFWGRTKTNPFLL